MQKKDREQWVARQILWEQLREAPARCPMFSGICMVKRNHWMRAVLAFGAAVYSRVRTELKVRVGLRCLENGYLVVCTRTSKYNTEGACLRNAKKLSRLCLQAVVVTVIAE